MTSVGLAIKNGILFALIILIVHVALRKAEGEGEGEGKGGAPAFPPAIQEVAEEKVEVVSAAAASVEDPSLLTYVFGESDQATSQTVVTTKKTSTTSSKAVAARGNIGIGSVGQGPYMVVGSYTDENGLCGGNVFKSSGLSGFDGFQDASSYSPL
jgi:hypothetical protein